jgi:hypothetical protein
MAYASNKQGFLYRVLDKKGVYQRQGTSSKHWQPGMNDGGLVVRFATTPGQQIQLNCK